MGQKLSCCRRKSTQFYKQQDQLHQLKIENDPAEVLNSLQHISEREAGELGDDPSANPSAGPLFVSKSQYLHSQRPRSQNNLNKRKSNSCSTIFLDDCTVSHPNMKSMLRCVSLAIYYHVSKESSKTILGVFDENSFGGAFSDEPPDFKTIYRFLRALFNATSLSSECAIITLVYLERLLTYADIDIIPRTWKRILLAALLLASKVWDDQAVWNVDYCHILQDITIDDMNELERRFLELLQFNINVPSSVYAKYYFELRRLADANDFSVEPLNEVRAQKLEAMSRVCENNLINLRKNLKISSSYDSLSFHRKSAAILS